jgi:hypothetical protein
MRVSPESLVATFVCSGRRLNSRTVAEFRREYGCRRSAPLLARQHVAPTNQGIVIENEASGVARLGAKVIKIEVQSLHDAGGDKNR